MEVRAGIEPAFKDLQSSASPLCHRTLPEWAAISTATAVRVKCNDLSRHRTTGSKAVWLTHAGGFSRVCASEFVLTLNKFMFHRIPMAF